MLPIPQHNQLIQIALTLTFLIGIILSFSLFPAGVAVPGVLILAALCGGYMAMATGANDTANNLGPAVGSKAISLSTALVIAVVFESAGALIAGGDVMNTIKGEIIDPDIIGNQQDFVWQRLGPSA